MVNVVEQNKPERVTLMLDGDIATKLRLRQAKKIQQTNKGCSFSKIVNDTLRKIL